MAAAINQERWTLADKQAGYELGCDGYMTVHDVMDFLCYSESKVRNLVRDRQLRHTKAGRSQQGAVRICRRSVIEFAKSLEG